MNRYGTGPGDPFYDAWMLEVTCSDCGKRKAENNGERWCTESQCWDCYRKHGAPENRGLPNAVELFTAWKCNRLDSMPAPELADRVLKIPGVVRAVAVVVLALLVVVVTLASQGCDTSTASDPERPATQYDVGIAYAIEFHTTRGDFCVMAGHKGGLACDWIDPPPSSTNQEATP